MRNGHTAFGECPKCFDEIDSGVFDKRHMLHGPVLVILQAVKNTSQHSKPQSPIVILAEAHHYLRESLQSKPQFWLELKKKFAKLC